MYCYYYMCISISKLHCKLSTLQLKKNHPLELLNVIYCIMIWRNKYHSILFYSILFYSILFYSILFYSILFYSILFYSILFYSILFYSILFYSILLYILGCLVDWLIAIAGKGSITIVHFVTIFGAFCMMLGMGSVFLKSIANKVGVTSCDR